MSKRVASEAVPETTESKKETRVGETPLNHECYIIHGKNKVKFDPENLIIGDPAGKSIKMSKFSYRMKYANGTHEDISPVLMQTPNLFSFWGFKDNTWDKSDPNSKTRLQIDATFKDPESSTLAVLRATQAKIDTEIKSRKETFIASNKRSDEMVDYMMNPLVVHKENNDGGFYDPKIFFKIRSKEEEGIIGAEVEAYSADSTRSSFKEVEVTTFGKGCTYRAVVMFEGIYVNNKSITPKLRAINLQKISDGVDIHKPFLFNDEPATELAK